MMFTVTEIYVYPIKGLGAVKLKKATVTETGFAYDRFWMLVDSDGECLTQRESREMALFQIELTDAGIQVSFRGESLFISNTAQETPEFMECHIWEDTVIVAKEPNTIAEWFSKQLRHQVFLVRMAPDSTRYVKRHAPSKVHFPDSSPFLVLGEASLELLNSKLEEPLSMDRFRPNIVFSGGQPHEEDDWQKITIGESQLESTKLCARCTVTTINQQTAVKGEEPLLSLSKYRLIGRKIMFGHYFKAVETFGRQISVGDSIEVSHRKSQILS